MLDILDLSKAITGEEGPSWLHKFGALFPGSATFTWGSVISSSFLGDQVKHALLGANVTLTVDPEGIMFDNIDTAAARAFHGLGAGAVGLATALLAGVGGNFGMTLGPNTSLTYYASNLGVTRGETYQYKAPTLFMDWSAVANGVKALTLLIAGGAIASDICGKVFGGASTEGGEWGILAGRAFVQRFMGVLRLLEEENAIAEAARPDPGGHGQGRRSRRAVLQSTRSSPKPPKSDPARKTMTPPPRWPRQPRVDHLATARVWPSSSGNVGRSRPTSPRPTRFTPGTTPSRPRTSRSAHATGKFRLRPCLNHL